MNRSKRWKLLKENPFDGCTVDVDPHQPAHLTKEEFKALVEAIADGELREMVILTVLAGLRLGELLHLKWADVDLDRRFVAIRSSKNFRIKRGSFRVVPLNPYATTILQDRRAKSQSELHASVEALQRSLRSENECLAPWRSKARNRSR